MPSISSEAKPINDIPVDEMTTEELVKRYGYPKEISYEDGVGLCREGKHNFIFCTMYRSGDATGVDYGEVGFHMVNVMERYVFEKELPDGLYVGEVDYNWFEEPF